MRKANWRSTGPRQRAAATQVGGRGGQVVRSWQTDAGEGRHVRREAAKFLGQVTS